MKTNRKLQLGAAVVFANGLLALMTLAPRPALANPCAEITDCASTFVCSNGLATCQHWAQSGCTATSFTCTGGFCPVGPQIHINCFYN
jgi:hypothetical protein